MTKPSKRAVRGAVLLEHYCSHHSVTSNDYSPLKVPLRGRGCNLPIVDALAHGLTAWCQAMRLNKPISPQYPIIEALNGILYIVVFAVNGLELTSIIYCFLTSALIVLSVIDWRTYEIPFGINIFILVLGILHVFLGHDNWSEYVIGFFCVSLFLEILLLVSGGRAIGGGDVKLMACAGLAIGWQNITLAFFLGCIIGSVIHLIRMKVTNAGNRLAMGPYLAAGIFISMLWGEKMISAYLTLAGF